MCPSQLLRGGGGGAQMALPVSDISEWIQIEGQGRRGHVFLLTLIKGHRSVCIPDLREFKFNNIIYTLTLHRSIILGNWYLILSFDLLREKIFTTIDLFSIIHKCIKIRFQNCN